MYVMGGHNLHLITLVFPTPGVPVWKILWSSKCPEDPCTTNVKPQHCLHGGILGAPQHIAISQVAVMHIADLIQMQCISAILYVHRLRCPAFKRDIPMMWIPKKSNYYPIFWIRECLSSQRQLPRCCNILIFVPAPEELPSLPRRTFWCFLFSCLLWPELLRACLKACALTGSITAAKKNRCDASPVFSIAMMIENAWSTFVGFLYTTYRHSPKVREPKPGGFQTGGFPTFFGKGPDWVADPFGTVPRRCSKNRLRKRKGTNRENPRTIPEKNRENPKKDEKGHKRKETSRSGETPRLKHPRLVALDQSDGAMLSSLASPSQSQRCNALRWSFPRRKMTKCRIRGELSCSSPIIAATLHYNLTTNHHKVWHKCASLGTIVGCSGFILAL